MLAGAVGIRTATVSCTLYTQMALTLFRSGQAGRLLLVLLAMSAPLAALPLPLGAVQLGLPEVLLPIVAVALFAFPRGVPAFSWERRELLPVGLFLAAALLSLLVTEYPRQSLRELRLLIVEPVTVFLLLRWARWDVEWVTGAVRGWIGVGTVVAMLGVVLAVLGRGLVEAEGVNRALGPYPSPNHFALILGRIIPFALALTLLAPAGRWMYLAATVLMAAASLMTFSGGGWLGTGAAVLAVVAICRGPRLALGGLGAGLAVSLVALLGLRVERLTSRLDPSRGTGFLRVKLWEASLQMVRDHPLLGVGLDNFLYRYQQGYILPEATIEPNLSHPHNWLLHFWLSLGLLGVTSALWLLWLFFSTTHRLLRRAIRPETRALAAGATGSMIDFLVHGAVDNSYFLPDMALMFWITLAMVRVLDDRAAAEPR